MTKTAMEDAFIRAAFVASIWDPSNPNAKKVMAYCRKHLSPDWTSRAAREIGSIRLRHQWFDAQLNGDRAPNVLAAVRRHYERQHEKTYPAGSVTFKTTSEKPRGYAGDFDQTGQTHSQVCLEAV